MFVLAAWIVALGVVGGLCIAAGRGDAALLRQLLDYSRDQPSGAPPGPKRS